jgi:hypothetical protein
MRTRMVGVLSVAALALVAAGCGSSGAYDNTPRPPAPINVAVSISDARVSVSPARVGAGPVVLLVANESGSSRDLTLGPAGAGSACVTTDASSGPINPQDTARVSVELVRGTCTVGVEDVGVAPARLVVGAPRASAQADLLQP